MKPINKNQKHHLMTSKRKLLFTTFLGTTLLLIPVALVYIDPVLRYTQYSLRLENDTMMHEVLLRPFEGLKLYVRVFNVTNAMEFLNGTDDKVKVVEVGPFVYVENRTNEDVVINPEPGVMWLTPKMEAVFLPEESIGDPKDIYVTVPNSPLLCATSLLSKYPYFIQQLFNFIVKSTNSKPFQKIRLYDVLWGYDDPLVAMANKLVPGLVYYKSFGFLDRMYDHDFDYRLEVGTENSDKFSLRQSIRVPPKNNPDSKAYIKKILTFPNYTYEGEVFPSVLSPDQPLYIHRPSICLMSRFQYNSSRAMSYGGDAYVYKLHESFLNSFEACNSKGWCPRGLISLSPCYLNLPLVVSKGHFLEGDPRLLDRLEGLKPDRKLHDTELVIDPIVGVTVSTRASIQISVFVSDTSYSPGTSRLQDTVLPLILYNIKAPRLIKEAADALKFVYTDGPRMLLASHICCVLVGLGLLVYVAKLLHHNRLAGNRRINCSIRRPML